MTRNPTLGPIEPYGINDCRRVIAGTIADNPNPVVCGRPATHHLELADPDLDTSLIACDEHAAEARQWWDIRDAHPFGGVCTMPGTVWIDSTPDEPGRCAWHLDDPDLVAAANAPVEEPTGAPT